MRKSLQLGISITIKFTHASKRALRGLFTVLAFYAAASFANAQSYTLTDLGTLGGDLNVATGINDFGTVVGYSSYKSLSGNDSRAFIYSSGQMSALEGAHVARGINNAGTVVGDFYIPGGWDHAFSYSNGQLTDLGAFGGSSSFSIAYAINNPGTIVGWSNSSPSGDNGRFFIYSNGVMTDPSLLSGFSYTDARGVNTAGTVVGQLTIGGISSRAFVYTPDGQFSILGTLGGFSSAAYGINDAGTVVGAAYAPANTFAFSYHNGQMTNLGSLDASIGQAFASGINNEGTIVGSSDVGAGYHAFIYTNGQMTDLNTLVDLPSDFLRDAVAINDLGQIVANSADGRAFLLTPVPEPATYAAIMGAAVFWVVAIRRKRRTAT